MGYDGCCKEKNNMRIGIVLGSDAQSGGGFQHEIAILENLQLYASESGHQFFIFSHEFLFDTKSLECNNLKFIKVKIKPFILRAINYILKKILRNQLFRKTPIQNAVDEIKIELMYYPGPYGNCIDIDVPYILTVWDLQHRLHPEFPEVSTRGIWGGREKFYQEAIGKAYAIIVDEEAGKEDVVNFYNVRDEKVYVLPYIPPNIKRMGEVSIKILQDKYGIKSNYIFYPAQFWPHKNHVAILKALKIIKEEYNVEISVVFVGSDKGNMDYLKKLTFDLGLTNQVFFPGFVPDEEIPAFYKGAMALVMPTYFGPTNIPVYEAFAYQCPVISSDIRGIRDQVGDAGFLVYPADFKALSEAILKMYNDTDLRAKLITNGTKKIQSWSGKQYIENLIKIIDGFSNTRLCWENKYRLK